MTRPYRIILVDDHAVVREGTREMLQATQSPTVHFTVVATLPSGEALLQLLTDVTEHSEDLILLDINLPGESGFTLLPKIRDLAPQIKVVYFSAYTDVGYVRKALELRPDGYLSKTISAEQLREKLLALLAHQQQAIFSEEITACITQIETQHKQESLSPREREILLLVASGNTNQQIAKTLHLSVKTVDSHVANLMKKLSLNNRSQLTAYAYSQALIGRNSL